MTKGTIVVIDDEPELLGMVRDMLRMDGYRVETCMQLEAAIQMARESQPQLFLIDIMLAGQSGIEVAEELRAAGYGHIPMIGMSASRLMTKVASESGAFTDIIDKPFEVPALLDCIQRYLSASAAKY